MILSVTPFTKSLPEEGFVVFVSADQTGRNIRTILKHALGGAAADVCGNRHESHEEKNNEAGPLQFLVFSGDCHKKQPESNAEANRWEMIQ